MKIILTENQLMNVLERIENNKVTCDNCGWSWDLSEGGDDKYVCHKCGYDNIPNENE